MASHGLGPTRAKVLNLLQRSNAPLTATDVSSELGLHPNSARHHLGQLVDAGYADRAPIPTHTTGRPKVGFSPSQEAPAVSDKHLVELTSVLLEHFCVDDETARAAGTAWGRKLSEDNATLPEVVDAMADAGFVPDLAADALTFGRCPFRDQLSPEALNAVCQVHLGYLQAALPDQQLGEFEIGDVCRITLTPMSVPTG
ncbi:MAG: helix-turn-helix domain-containing protein [Propionibacterium sp.]|nr:helix-turn-helix domain-containing protein [Propionibacterium sp.]